MKGEREVYKMRHRRRGGFGRSMPLEPEVEPPSEPDLMICLVMSWNAGVTLMSRLALVS